MSGGIVTLGETMGLLRARSIGSLAHESEFTLGIGGAESNVAIGVARLGGAATWIGRVGADALGDRVVRELRGEGLDVRAVVDPTRSTGLMIKERPILGRTRVTYFRRDSAGSSLAPKDVDVNLVKAAGVLHVTGITPALSSSAAAAVEFAVDVAVESGVPVSFDVNHRAALWSTADARDWYRRIAARATIVFAGADEAAVLVGSGSAPQLAARISLLGPTEVVIKLGSEGCHAIVDGGTLTVEAVPVVALDTVGAGDAFVAGYLAERLRGSSPDTRLDTAVKAGAFACLGPGDWESSARRSELSMLGDGDPVSR